MSITYPVSPLREVIWRSRDQIPDEKLMCFVQDKNAIHALCEFRQGNFTVISQLETVDIDNIVDWCPAVLGDFFSVGDFENHEELFINGHKVIFDTE